MCLICICSTKHLQNILEFQSVTFLLPEKTTGSDLRETTSFYGLPLCLGQWLVK